MKSVELGDLNMLRFRGRLSSLPKIEIRFVFVGVYVYG